MKRTIQYCLLLTSLLAFHSSASDPLWTNSLADKADWSMVTTAGTLLVNTGMEVAHIDPDTGDFLWSKTIDKKLTPYNFHDLEGSGFLLIAEQFQNMPPKTKLMMFDLMTGEQIWDSGELFASNLAVIPDIERGQLLFIGGFPGNREDRTSGNLMRAYDIATGEIKFQSTLSKFGKIPMHVTDTSGMFSVATDLSGHARPVIEDNIAYLSYRGITAVDLDNGEILWEQTFDTVDSGLKNSFSDIVIDGDTIYKTGRGSVVAIDKRSGEFVWKSKHRKKEMMPEIHVLDDQVVVRVGGMFSNGKDLVPVKPFGVRSIDKANGDVRWEWLKAKNSITNMAVLPEVSQAIVADEKSLYRLDLATSKRKGHVLEKRNLEFKRKMGAADAAVAGGKVMSGLMSGGLIGGLQGGIRAAAGNDRADPPSTITRLGNSLVVSGNYHVLSYDAMSDADNWSIAFAPPGVNPMMLALSGATMAFTATANMGMHTNWSTRNNKLNNALTSADRLGSIMTRRFAAAESAGTVSFFLTKAGEDMPGAKLQLLGIDLQTGESIGAVPIEEKDPVFTVDNVGKRVYYFHNEREIRAFGF